MERGHVSNKQQHRRNTRSSCRSTMRTPELEDTGGNNGARIARDDHYVPVATIVRIMRRIIPPQAKVAEDAKESVQECVSEFISFITGEAKERCQRERRRTVTAEDLLWAMGKLGFDDYMHTLTLYLNRYRQHEYELTTVHSEPFVKRVVGFGQRPPHPPVHFTPAATNYGAVFPVGQSHGFFYTNE